MSDNRKILVAKRKNERDANSNFSGHRGQICGNFKQGVKRPTAFSAAPKKNLANERLKRLRLTLKEEVKNTSELQSQCASSACLNRVNAQKKLDNLRKRPQSAPEQGFGVKVAKQEINESSGSSFIFTQEQTIYKNTSTPVTPDCYKVPTLQQDLVNNVEAMEWCPNEDDTSITLNASTSTTDIDNFPVLNSSKSNKLNFFIVVDTNILLSHLGLIKEIITMEITDNREPILFIPWIVIEELDFIKDDSNKTSLRNRAQEAIKYVELILSKKHSRMMGQTLNEVNEQKNVGRSPDNKIISCCMQVKEKYKTLILLTNDINLKNKAHLNNIPVCSHSEMKLKILQVLDRSKADRILEKMTCLCTNVIHECAKNAYGTACTRMPIYQSSPKSLQECISLFKHYWFPVFEEVLIKQFKKSIDDLSTFLSKNKEIKDGTKELNELLRLCVRVCLFLKDVDCCKDIIEDTICTLNSIIES